MAKKKSTASAAPQSPATVKAAKAAAKASKPAAVKKTSAKSESKAATNGAASTTVTTLGNHQIGEAAGAVWYYLSENGEASLSAIKKELSLSADLLLAAVGWLAREEKLKFNVSGKTVKLSLK